MRINGLNRREIVTLAPAETIDIYKFSKKVSMARANFEGHSLVGLRARGIDFSGASFRGVDLTQADISRSNLSGANFQGATLLYCRMRECTFSPETVLHWRSHDLLAAVLDFVARQEYEQTQDKATFVRHRLWASLPHSFREWCWPEYNQYLPGDMQRWLVEALVPWVKTDPDPQHNVPTELLAGVKMYGLA